MRGVTMKFIEAPLCCLLLYIMCIMPHLRIMKVFIFNVCLTLNLWFKKFVFLFVSWHTNIYKQCFCTEYHLHFWPESSCTVLLLIWDRTPNWMSHTPALIRKGISWQSCLAWESLYTLSNKNPSAWNFLSPEPEVTCGTVAIIIRVILLSPYLCIRGVSLSSIHYNQSHRVYINQRQQYICLIWN